jgi:hypothetical protein
MDIKLLCDWNSHKKGEVIRPDPSHLAALINHGYAEIVGSKMEFILMDVQVSNKESEHLWISLNENDS